MHFVYGPALRGKEGEWTALHELASPIKQLIRPRMILAPAKVDAHPPLSAEMSGTGVLLHAKTLRRCWPKERPVEFDPDHVERGLPAADREKGLRTLFDEARSDGHGVIPVVGLASLKRGLGPLYRKLVIDDLITLRLTEIDLIDPDTFETIKRGLGELNIDPARNNLVLDFGAADFTDVSITAGVIEAGIEDALEGAPWDTVTFQGSSYPTTNPAPVGGGINVPRNEALAWRKAVAGFDGDATRLPFGDYGADHAEVQFGPGGGRAVPHLRWANGDEWQVEHGGDAGQWITRMRDVAKRLRVSGASPGAGYCTGDTYVDGLITGPSGCGNPTTWRTKNMTRHMTLVALERARALDIDVVVPSAVPSLMQEGFTFV